MPEPAPVSGGLARMEPQAELRWISDRFARLWAQAEVSGPRVPALADCLALAERSVACWEQIAAGQQRISRPVRDGLIIARRNPAELREQAAGAATANSVATR
ncbi:hypothetical protein [Amycolatopsis sp. NPDC051903]|uniref:hypothetical protein n=1 Tax=Amycolatopsis sp. NPDC051903 TaxID=3363936 RepID=UPI00379B46C0